MAIWRGSFLKTPVLLCLELSTSAHVRNGRSTCRGKMHPLRRDWPQRAGVLPVEWFGSSSPSVHHGTDLGRMHYRGVCCAGWRRDRTQHRAVGSAHSPWPVGQFDTAHRGFVAHAGPFSCWWSASAVDYWQRIAKRARKWRRRGLLAADLFCNIHVEAVAFRPIPLLFLGTRPQFDSPQGTRSLSGQSCLQRMIQRRFFDDCGLCWCFDVRSVDQNECPSFLRLAPTYPTAIPGECLRTANMQCDAGPRFSAKRPLSIHHFLAVYDELSPPARRDAPDNFGRSKLADQWPVAIARHDNGS